MSQDDFGCFRDDPHFQRRSLWLTVGGGPKAEGLAIPLSGISDSFCPPDGTCA